jgi:hypothetical protein
VKAYYTSNHAAGILPAHLEATAGREVGRDIALRCPRPRSSGRNPCAAERDADGAARRPYRCWFRDVAPIRVVISHVLLLLALLASSFSSSALERLEPAEGCYFGINLGEGDTVARLNSRLGLTPAVYVQFFHFPFTTVLRDELKNFLTQVQPTRGIALITLEPFQGLAAVTEADCLDLAGLCATYEAQGLGGILIRFAHEMNGNWYPWCQQPILYKEKFHLLSQIIRTNTARTAMLWAPHNGIGYPFSTNGLYQATRGTADFLALDTDGDGRLTAHDDMYEPYYPGDDAVDWVGMTIYHWGVTYPWLENEMPTTNNFAATLAGSEHVPPIPDFYARYCADGVHNKPLTIPETSAFYNPQQPAGAGEFLIKQAWWRQVFNISDENTSAVNIAVHLPKLKCINWFDHYKPEAEAQNQWIDWRISAHPVIREAFLEYLRTPWQGRPYFLTAQEFDCQQRPDCITAEHLPGVIPLTGSVMVALTTKAQTNCDLVIDLLDDDFQWQGGTRASVEPGVQSVNAYLTLEHLLLDGKTYRWSIFLTPPGSNYLSAVAWYNGPSLVARAVMPSAQIIGYPPIIAPGPNFSVKVNYASAADGAVVQINILDLAYNWHGGGTVPVERGDGLIDVTVSPQSILTNGTYMLECFLSDAPENWQNTMARSANVTVQVSNIVSTDFIQALPQASTLPAGEVFRFLVSYAAADDRDLHVDLLDANTNFVAGTVQRVGASSGIQEMTIGYPSATPGSYFVTSFLTGPGQTWTQALAWGAVQQVTVLSANYLEWVEWRWGVVLGSDLILPDEDADGDGASNDAERIAQTAPLDRDDVLRLNTARVGSQLTLSWRSATFRQYQLLERTDVGAESWAPVGAMLDGTGDILQVPIDLQAAGPRKFYRLQVSER